MSNFGGRTGKERWEDAIVSIVILNCTFDREQNSMVEYIVPARLSFPLLHNVREKTFADIQVPN